MSLIIYPVPECVTRIKALSHPADLAAVAEALELRAQALGDEARGRVAILLLGAVTSLEEARKVALLSMDSTLRSNLSVGMPLDLMIIRRDECRVHLRERIEAGNPSFSAMSEGWSKALRDAFAALPS